MRTYSHPVLAALSFLQDSCSPEGAVGSYAGRFQSADDAVDVLRRHSGKDFGPDIARWRDWFRHNRWAIEPIDLIESEEHAAVPPSHMKRVDQSITDTWLESDPRG
jgi:hypothetical protein